MPQLKRSCLSEHDQAVLDSIFNPFQIDPSNVPNVFDVQLSDEVQDPTEEQTKEVENSTKFELGGVQAAESGNLEKAVLLFSSAIEAAPNRASPHNNRAQAYRLQGNDEDALIDLEKALILSQNSGRTGCRALCQKGLILRKRENLDAARMNFETAAKLGSKFARAQLVEMNPYAALCNQMLREAFEKLS